MAYAIGVIGSNFGDEGKGLMTDYFCHQSIAKKEKCIVVCHNGGSQRGHTVTCADKLYQHTFRHLGSGTLAGADTYWSKDFILNPMMFRKEHEDLVSRGYETKIYVHKNCRVSTPYDMMLNQIIEDSRGENRHGSCGMGIWETVQRYENYDYADTFMTIEELFNVPIKDVYNMLTTIRDEYVFHRLEENGIPCVPKDWEGVLNKDYLSAFVTDLTYMYANVKVVPDDMFLNDYDCIVFENGQGLLLDQNISGYGENTTPSNTGCRNILDICNNLNIERGLLCYVSRTYLTRHGNGRFDEECAKEEISLNIKPDMTNVANPFQGKLRYGKLSEESLALRVQEDSKGINTYIWETALAITHCNENEIDLEYLYENNVVDKIYTSNGQTYFSVEEYR
jgi:adenylosuccinate synthase